MPLAPYPVSFRFEMTNDDESLVFCVWCGGPNCSAYIFVYFCLPSATHKHINPTLNMTSSSSGSGSISRGHKAMRGRLSWKMGIHWLKATSYHGFIHSSMGPGAQWWCFLKLSTILGVFFLTDSTMVNHHFSLPFGEKSCCCFFFQPPNSRESKVSRVYEPIFVWNNPSEAIN